MSLVQQVEQVVFDKPREVRLAVAALLTGGHVLIEDLPGVGKTVLARALAQALGGSFARIQGTADLLPSDVTGVSVFQPSGGQWHFRPGPVFANVVLFDEINRATPRAQSALFEAMAEGQVTVEGATRSLPEPFLLLATQNPGGEAGTFALGTGQRDRFALVLSMGLPGPAAEAALLRGHGGRSALRELESSSASVASVGDAGDAREPASPQCDRLRVARRALDGLYADDRIIGYVLAVIEAARRDERAGGGPSPRASLSLLATARAHALLSGRDYVQPDDVVVAAPAVLAHRLAPLLPAAAGAEVVRQLLTTVPVPVS